MLLFSRRVRGKLVVVLVGLLNICFTGKILWNFLHITTGSDPPPPEVMVLQTRAGAAEIIKMTDTDANKEITVPKMNASWLPNFVIPTNAPSNTTEASKNTASGTNQRSLPPRVSLVYEPIVGTQRQHPHLGARDSQGKWGYVHDATNLRRIQQQAPTSLIVDNEYWRRANLSALCEIRDTEYEALQRIRLFDNKTHGQHIRALSNYSEHIRQSENKVLQSRYSGGPNETSATLFCGIYSSEPYRNKVEAIRQTWGSECDGFLVASNVTDAAFDMVDIPHFGEETYKNMWFKVRSMLVYIYNTYFDDYDWFHIGGDDMMVLVPNLRAYLESSKIKLAANRTSISNGHVDETRTKVTTKETPLLLGSLFAKNGQLDRAYMTGGPGYTLNRAALKLFVTKGLDLFRNRPKPTEDYFISQTLVKLGVRLEPALDSVGGELYHHFTPGRHYVTKPKLPKWYRVWTKPFPRPPGVNHSSVYSVAFHNVTTTEMLRFHALSHGWCRPSKLKAERSE